MATFLHTLQIFDYYFLMSHLKKDELNELIVTQSLRLDKLDQKGGVVLFFFF